MLPFTKLIRISLVYDNDGNHDYFRELSSLRGIPSADLCGWVFLLLLLEKPSFPILLAAPLVHRMLTRPAAHLLQFHFLSHFQGLEQLSLES